jgi:phage terminase small subunit
VTDAQAVAPKKLSGQREAFVGYYIGAAKFNATKAAVMAGYSERSAYSQGSALLKIPEVSARISDELKIRAMPADAVLAELTDVASADWHEFVKVKTNPRTGEQIEVAMDLGAKVKSLEILAKAHGLLTDRVDISGLLTSRVEMVGVDPDSI